MKARAVAALLAFPLAACADNYRIGDQVLVDYDGNRCPGYIIDLKGKTRFRVHFDFEGYEWQDDVSLDKLLGRAQPPVVACPLPRRVRNALGLRSANANAEQAQASPYRVGDRVRVRWRDSVYPATITQVVASDRLLVHYDGHENVWDETIGPDRIVDRYH